MTTGAAGVPSARPPRRRGALATVRIVLAVLVLAGVVLALWRNWGAVSPHLGDVSLRAWALALLAGFVSPFLGMLGWRALLTDLGSRLHIAPASGVFLVGQLGKYLPGSVWSVFAQAEMAARLGVPRRRTGVVGLVTMALSLLTGVIIAVPSLPVLLRRGDSSTAVLVGVAGMLFVIAMWPPLLNRGIRLGLRLLRRDPLEHDLSGRGIVTGGAWTLLAWLATGAICWAFAADLVPDSADTGEVALISLSGFCLAAVVGMASVLLPAGVGVREGILLLLLVTVMPGSAATAVVVLTRFVTLAMDILWAGIGWLWARAHHLLPDRHTVTVRPPD